MGSWKGKHPVWLMPGELRRLQGLADRFWHDAGSRPPQDKSGDQAGSDAKLGVGVRCSLRPVTSTVNRPGPAFPPGSRKNMMTRPFGDQVGPSLWKPSVRILSPDPSGCM